MLPPKRIVRHFIDRTQDHIQAVRRNINILLETVPELDTTLMLQRAWDHDRSKFESPELIPYIWKTWWFRCQRSDEPYVGPDIEDKFLESVQCHYQSNSHHPEHFQSAQEMTEEDLAEMVADWYAVGTEKGTNTTEWAKEAIPKWDLSEGQVDFIFSCIGLLDGYGSSNTNISEVSAAADTIMFFDLVDNGVGSEEDGFDGRVWTYTPNGYTDLFGYRPEQPSAPTEAMEALRQEVDEPIATNMTLCATKDRIRWTMLVMAPGDTVPPLFEPLYVVDHSQYEKGILEPGDTHWPDDIELAYVPQFPDSSYLFIDEKEKIYWPEVPGWSIDCEDEKPQESQHSEVIYTSSSKPQINVVMEGGDIEYYWPSDDAGTWHIPETDWKVQGTFDLKDIKEQLKRAEDEGRQYLEKLVAKVQIPKGWTLEPSDFQQLNFSRGPLQVTFDLWSDVLEGDVGSILIAGYPDRLSPDDFPESWTSDDNTSDLLEQIIKVSEIDTDDPWDTVLQTDAVGLWELRAKSPTSWEWSRTDKEPDNVYQNVKTPPATPEDAISRLRSAGEGNILYQGPGGLRFILLPDSKKAPIGYEPIGAIWGGALTAPQLQGWEKATENIPGLSKKISDLPTQEEVVGFLHSTDLSLYV